MSNIFNKPDTLENIRTYTTTIGDGVNTKFKIQHNLGTCYVYISIYKKDMVLVDNIPIIRHYLPLGDITLLEFEVAPAMDELTVVFFA